MAPHEGIRMNLFRFMVPKSMVETIRDDSTVRQALEKMRFHRYSALPVLDSEQRYVGTVRNDDLFRYFMERECFDARFGEGVQVRDILTEAPIRPLRHTSSMQDVIEGVKEHNFVPVVDDRGCFIGIILRREILSYLLQFYKESK